MGLGGGIELFLEQFETRLGLAFVVAGLTVLVEGFDHGLVLALRLLERLLAFSQLHGEELDLLVAHGDVLL